MRSHSEDFCTYSTISSDPGVLNSLSFLSDLFLLVKKARMDRSNGSPNMQNAPFIENRIFRNPRTKVCNGGIRTGLNPHHFLASHGDREVHIENQVAPLV